MYISGNIRLLKNLNQQHVLNIIRMTPGITAPEISRRTKLQISTISYILKELNQWNLIHKNGVGQSTVQGGKKPILWDLQSQYGYILGLEIKPLEIRLVVIDFKGSILYKKKFSIAFFALDQNMIEAIHTIIHQVIGEKSLETQHVLGMGIGISGMVDAKKGLILVSDSFNLKNYPLKHLIQAQYSFPVEIVNDANAGALSIKWYNHLQSMVPHILYTNVNENNYHLGIGVGFVINHELFTGSHGVAGERRFQQIPQVYNRLIKKAMTLMHDSAGRLNGREATGLFGKLLILLQQNSSGSREFLSELTSFLGQELLYIIELFDPDSLIIGGDIVEIADYLKPGLIDFLNYHSIYQSDIAKMVSFTNQGVFEVALGSSAMIYRQFFQN